MKKLRLAIACCLLPIAFLFAASISSAFDFESASISELKDIQYAPDQILVTFNDGVSDNEIAQVHKSLGALSARESYGKFYHLVTVREGTVDEMVRAYSQIPSVKHAEPDYFRFINFTPNDEFYSYQWNFPQINLPSAWNKSTGSGATVAIVDTGVNPNGNDDFGGRLIQGHNFVKNTNDSSDDNGHGTHVAGTVGEETNNSTGCAGIAFDANILAVKVMNRRGVGYSRNIIDGIRWAADNGADVINLSLGSTTSSQTEEDAINYAYNKGVVICASSGNDGANTVSYPAAYVNCIAVGATRYDKQLAPYSNTGDALDVVAPGGDISVDQNNDGNPDGILQETFTRFLFRYYWDYYYFQGTSMASPHVAGVAALIISLHPTYTPAQVRNALQSSAQDLGATGWDSSFGWGLIDANASLNK
ncbi:MAG TPA: S8 family peptidase [Thermodesulfobacteriota bacterium]|nr:S8 family peptidase [Thermodesulfobacteriota bacterium]